MIIPLRGFHDHRTPPMPPSVATKNNLHFAHTTQDSTVYPSMSLPCREFFFFNNDAPKKNQPIHWFLLIGKPMWFWVEVAKR